MTWHRYLLFDPFIFSDSAIKLIQIYPPLDFAKVPTHSSPAHSTHDANSARGTPLPTPQIYADIDYVTRPTVEWDYDNLQQVIVDGGTYTWSTLCVRRGDPSLCTARRDAQLCRCSRCSWHDVGRAWVLQQRRDVLGGKPDVVDGRW